jgi:DNA ligase 1
LTRQEPDVWFEPGLVLEILSAELTLSRSTPSAGADQRAGRPGDAVSAVHRAMARRQEAPQDATTTQELIDL